MYKTPEVILISHSPNPETVIASAARLCYSPDTIEEIMRKLTVEKIDNMISLLSDMGHESPFEHITYTFALEGVSRAMTHQLVRHRIASYSQRSQRYIVDNNFDYIMPPSISEDDACIDVFKDTLKNIQVAYNALHYRLLTNQIISYLRLNDHIERIIPEGENRIEWFKRNMRVETKEFEKKAAEDARYLLPNAAETKIFVTMNIRSLWNFFNHRNCNRAQWEIKHISKEMLRLCKSENPILFTGAGPHCIKGICPENAMQCNQLKGKIPTEVEVKELIATYYKKGV